jgi:DNA (cytosine-5)-methyltransferase 1
MVLMPPVLRHNFSWLHYVVLGRDFETSDGPGSIGWKESETAYTQPSTGVDAVCYGLDSEVNATEDSIGTLKAYSGENSGTPLACVAYGIDATSVGCGIQPEITHTLDASGQPAVFHAYGVRSANTSSNGCGVQAELTHTLDGAGPHSVCYSIHPHAIGRKPEAGPQAKPWTDDGVAYTQDSRGSPQAVCYDSRLGSEVMVRPTVDARIGDGPRRNQGGVVCFAQNTRSELRTMPVSGALAANPGTKQTSYVMDGRGRPEYVIRRITPVEAERLQGLPDNYTKVPGVSDTARYKIIGNGFAVPVIRYIGLRIEAALAYENQQKEGWF